MYRLTYDEWVEQYKPFTNHLTNEGFAYETYGDELDYITQQDDNFIWTEMDGDEGVSIVEGYHLVNRIQYYITQVPHEAGKSYEIPISIDKECFCVEDGEGNEDCYTCGGTFYETIWIHDREELEEIFGGNK